MILLIGGIMRSGKTIISTRLAKEYGVSLVQTDHLILALQKAYPSTNVGKGGLDYDALCDAFFPFLSELLLNFSGEQSMDYIVEGYYVRPKDISRLPDTISSFFLGYTSISAEDKMRQIREYAENNPCYSSGISDTKLRKYVERWIAQSHALKMDSIQRGFRFLDTSVDLTSALAAIRQTISFTRGPEQEPHSNLSPFRG